MKQFFIVSAVSGLLATAHAELLLKLDEPILGNTPMPISEDIDYNIFGQQIAVTAKYPMICNQIENSAIASQLTVAVNSPNKNSASSGVVGLLQSVGYNINGGEISIVSENLNKSLCLTSKLHDVIFEDNFYGDNWVQEYPNNFYFTGIEEDQPVNTQFTVGVEYVNNSGMMQELDLIDFWPDNPSLSVFADHNGTDCSIYDAQSDFVGSCPTNLSERGKYRNIFLASGYKIVTQNNLLIHPNSQVGENLYLMTAIFTKVNTIQSGGQNQSFSGVEFIEAKIRVAETPNP